MVKKKAIRRRRKAESGFTLVELLVVVAIIGALTAIVIPRVANRAPDARAKVNAAVVQQIESTSELYYLDMGKYPDNAGELKAAGYLKQDPKILYKSSGETKYQANQLTIDSGTGRVVTTDLEDQ